MKWMAPVLAVLLLLLLLLAKLPATWLDYTVRHYSRGALGVTATQGTLWRGRGDLQAILPSGEVKTLDKVTWRVDLAALLKGGMRVEVLREADVRPVLDAFAGLSGWTVYKLDLRLPASLLGVFSSTLSQLGLSGQMQFNLDGLGWGAGVIKGGGQVLWQDAGSTVTRVHPLGNYYVALHGKGDALEYRLTTVGGKLDLHGNGTWRPGAYPMFDGQAVPLPAQREELAPLLRMLGKDSGTGIYTLVLDANTGLSAR